MSKDLLASKIIFNDAEPGVTGNADNPVTIVAIVGTAERGPIGEAVLCTSWPDFVKKFGSHYANGSLAIQALEFYGEGGRFLYVVRTAHYTDVTNPATLTALKAAGNVMTVSAAPEPAIVDGGNAEPFSMSDGDTLDLSEDGAPLVTVTFLGKKAQIDSAAGVAWPLNLVGGETLDVAIDGGLTQTITINALDITPGAATQLEVANAINKELLDGSAFVNAGEVRIVSDTRGTNSIVEIVGGTANALLLYPLGPVGSVGSNVADITGVTGAEVKTLVEAALATVTVSTLAGGFVRIETTGTGAVKSLQVLASSVNADTIIGFDNLVHNGADIGQTPTMTSEAKDEGAYGNSVQIQVTEASSGEATEFNLYVLFEGNVVERYPNVTMTTTADNYVVSAVNPKSYYVQLTDLALGTRPTDMTNAAQTGGDDGLVGLNDNDYIGDGAAQTGLYAINAVPHITLLSIPGVQTPSVHNAEWNYVLNARNGLGYAVLSVPQGYDAEQAQTYVKTTASLYNATDLAAIYWPYITITNPLKTVYGADDTIDVSNEGAVLGRFCKTHGSKPGGIYQSPAGVYYGQLTTVLGVAQDEALAEEKRDIVYPARINPITKEEGTPWYIDGSRGLSDSTYTNFPNVSQRLGRNQIEYDLKKLLIFAKHRSATTETLQEMYRVAYAYMVTQMDLGAFVSKVPEEAFRIDVGEGINTAAELRAGRAHMEVAFKFPGVIEWIIVELTQDVEVLAA